MKKNLLVLPLLGLMLVGCSNDTASGTNNESSNLPESTTGQISTQTETSEDVSTDTSTEVDIKATSVTLDLESADIYRGGKQKFVATVLPADTTDEVVWSIEKAEGVVDLTENVYVLEDTVYVNKYATLGDAKYTLKVTAGDVSDTAVLNIKELNLGTEAQPIGPKEALDLYTNHAYELSRLDELFVKGTVANAELVEGYDTKFSGDLVNGEDVLHFYSCDFKETPTPINGREAILTGKVVDYEGTIQLNKPKMVSVGELPNATDFALGETAVTLKAGDTYQIEASESPAGYPATYTYASDNEFVTVSETGLITVSTEATAGTANVTVTMNETVEKTLVVTIKGNDIFKGTLDTATLENAPADDTALDIEVGAVTLTGTQGSAGTKLRWFNGTIRTYIDNILTITPKAGKAIVSVAITTSDGEFASNETGKITNGKISYASKVTTITPINSTDPIVITVTGKKTITKIETIAVNPREATDFTIAATGEVAVGGSYTLTPTLTPEYSTGAITWTVDNEAKATVEGNVIKLTAAAVVDDTIKVTGTLNGTAITHEVTLTVIKLQNVVATFVCKNGGDVKTGIAFGGDNNDLVTFKYINGGQKPAFSGTQLKFYQDNEFNISCSADFVITTIEFKGNAGGFDMTSDNATITKGKGYVATVNAGLNSVNIKCGKGGQAKITDIIVNLVPAA